MSLEELRHRMPALKGRSQAVCDEVEALKSMALDQSAMLKLADVLSSFRERLQKSAETLDVSEKRRIVRLLVKEVAVGDNAITIRHSIPVGRGPIAEGPAPEGATTPSQPRSGGSYALCPRRSFARCGQLTGGLPPPRSRPCWAHSADAGAGGPAKRTGTPQESRCRKRKAASGQDS